MKTIFLNRINAENFQNENLLSQLKEDGVTIHDKNLKIRQVFRALTNQKN